MNLLNSHFSIILLSLFSLYFSLCFASGDLYTSCGNNFSCGSNITEVGFPFWDDSSRPKECGHSELELTCDDSETAHIEINGMKFNVISIDQSTHSLKIVREDFVQDICLQDFSNTALDFNLFTITPGYNNITVFYGCPTPQADSYTGEVPATKPGQFTCTNTIGYFSPGVQGIGSTGCTASVVVPVSGSLIGQNSNLQLVINQGFEVTYKVQNETFCETCEKSYGRCGFNEENKVSCYCSDGTSGFTACSSDAAFSAKSGPGSGNEKSKTTSPPSGKSNNTQKKAIIGAVTGIGVLVLAAAFCTLFVARRRKRVLYQAQSRDLGPGIPISGVRSSNGYRSSRYTSSPSTILSQSIQSYPSSNSDFQDSMSYFGIKVFSYTELEDATENFNESRELGDGGFGTVYYGKLHDGRLVAVKRLYENSCKHMGQFMTEIEILARLRHKNLVTLFGCTSKKSRELLLVYEYIPNGTVADHLHGKLAKSNQLSWSVRLSIAVQTAEALAFLHKSDVIHRDVKTTNILLDNHFQVKVADFGLSRLFPTDVTHVSTAPQGTPGYVDPDYYQCYHLTEKSDVYSFGVVLIELISSKPAVDITRRRQDINLSKMALDRIKNNSLSDLVDPNLSYDTDYVVQKMVKSVAELAFMCLQQEKEMRPTMEEVMESLQGIQKEVMNVQKQVVLDFQESDDDAGALLKNVPPPLSPERQKGHI